MLERLCDRKYVSRGKLRTLQQVEGHKFAQNERRNSTFWSFNEVGEFIEQTIFMPGQNDKNVRSSINPLIIGRRRHKCMRAKLSPKQVQNHRRVAYVLVFFNPGMTKALVDRLRIAIYQSCLCSFRPASLNENCFSVWTCKEQWIVRKFQCKQ